MEAISAAQSETVQPLSRGSIRRGQLHQVAPAPGPAWLGQSHCRRRVRPHTLQVARNLSPDRSGWW